MRILKGLSASSGYAIAKVFYYDSDELKISADTAICDCASETKSFKNAIAKTNEQINTLIANLDKSSDQNQELIDIMQAHLALLNDEQVHEEIIDLINKDKTNAAFAVQSILNHYVKQFEQIDDPAFQARVTDIKDVYLRVIKNILKIEHVNFATIQEPCILVANDITPSISVQLNPKYIKGLITTQGSKTSHSAIIANNLEIPLVTSVPDLKTTFSNLKTEIIVDGVQGIAIIEPTKKQIKDYRTKQENYIKTRLELKKYQNIPPVTTDKMAVNVRANIGGYEDYLASLDYGNDSSGLFRTELLFMGSDHWPTQQEQCQEYSRVLNKAKDKLIVIRTLDIGGDKNLSYFDFPKEDNPFLGYRAIRLCLDYVDIFKTQLKAMLLANKNGNLAIMFPMIVDYEELLQTKVILKQAEHELTAAGETFNPNYKIGIMIETPASVILAEDLVKEIDFFSIGSNDLVQYTLAVDRMNPQLQKLYNPLNPAVIKSIAHVADISHKHNKTVAVCGSMGGEALALPFLIGVKIDYVSVALSRILPTKKIICSVSQAECAALADKMLKTPQVTKVTKIAWEFLVAKKLDNLI